MAADGAGDAAAGGRVPRARSSSSYGLPPDIKLLVGVERLDYTKGILDRFLALDELFQQHPEWIGRMVFLQIAAPSRSTLPAYQQLHQECLTSSTTFNERYGRGGYQPIIMLDRASRPGGALRALPRRRCLRGQQPA